jgi:hypothetical protein
MEGDDDVLKLELDGSAASGSKVVISFRKCFVSL